MQGQLAIFLIIMIAPFGYEDLLARSSTHLEVLVTVICSSEREIFGNEVTIRKFLKNSSALRLSYNLLSLIFLF